MSINLSNKRVVVTGSSLGIGQAIAIRLAGEGAKVVINARGEEALQETLAMIRDKGGEAVISAGSVADYDYAGSLIQTCIESYGGIDGLVNCAGIIEPVGSNISNISESDWKQLIDVHLHGTFNTCRHAVPHLMAQGSGTIINTSSHAFLGSYGGTGYAASKGATNSLSLAMAVDLAEHNINVNVVCPGAKTRMSTGDDYETLIHDLHRRGSLNDFMLEKSMNPPDPTHVASLYAYLLSDAAKDISGRVFWGTGGYLGLFNKNGDQLVAMRNHETKPPWSLDELHSKLNKHQYKEKEPLFNVVGAFGAIRLLVKQSLLMKLAGLQLQRPKKD